MLQDFPGEIRSRVAYRYYCHQCVMLLHEYGTEHLRICAGHCFCIFSAIEAQPWRANAWASIKIPSLTG
jgi:hypothetical protein